MSDFKFATKADARRFVWDQLEPQGMARAPFPPHNRIPSFAGASVAAARLFEVAPWRDARAIKVNPDTPRLASGFHLPDPEKIAPAAFEEAATLSTMTRHSAAVPVATTVHDLQVVDDFPTESNDLPLSHIFTPTRTLSVASPLDGPAGMEWWRLSEEDIGRMPVLAELRALVAQRANR